AAGGLPGGDQGTDRLDGQRAVDEAEVVVGRGQVAGAGADVVGARRAGGGGGGAQAGAARHAAARQGLAVDEATELGGEGGVGGAVEARGVLRRHRQRRLAHGEGGRPGHAVVVGRVGGGEG